MMQFSKQIKLSGSRGRQLIAGLFLFLAVTGFTGCGGGGGGGGATSGGGTVITPPVSQRTGSMSLSVNFPSVSGRNASVSSHALPSGAVLVEVDVFEVVNGLVALNASGTARLSRPSDAGGEVSQVLVLREGRYIARMASKDINGSVLSSAMEPVKIEANVLTRVPTILGITYTEAGFSPSNLSLKTGETLVIRHDGTAPATIALSGPGACFGTLERTGALACTIRNAGTFQITSSNGQSGTITVTQDSALLGQAEPSLGILRAEGLALTGSTYLATFLINNGGTTLPDGLLFDPGNGAGLQPVSGTTITVPYSNGSYIARLVSPAGATIAQRYVAVYEGVINTPAALTLNTLPTTVTASSLLVTGTAGLGQTVALTLGSTTFTTQASLSSGVFSFNLTLAQGTNIISVRAISQDGQLGPSTNGTVTFLTDNSAGVLASIVISGVGSTATAGVGISFTFQGFDANGLPVSFTPTLSNSGVTGSFTGNNTFTPISTGTGTIRVQGPGGIVGTANFEVTPGALAAITVSPGNLTAKSGETYTLSAIGKDSFGNVISGLSFSWTGTSVNGVNSSTGVFSPTSNSTGIVTATSGNISGKTCVSVSTVTTL